MQTTIKATKFAFDQRFWRVALLEEAARLQHLTVLLLLPRVDSQSLGLFHGFCPTPRLSGVRTKVLESSDWRRSHGAPKPLSGAEPMPRRIMVGSRIRTKSGATGPFNQSKEGLRSGVRRRNKLSWHRLHHSEGWTSDGRGQVLFITLPSTKDLLRWLVCSRCSKEPSCSLLVSSVTDAPEDAPEDAPGCSNCAC